jgi:hypothetical protein
MAVKEERPLGEVLLRDVRLSFAALDKPDDDSVNPKTGEVIKGKYKSNFLLERDSKTYDKNMSLIEDAIEDVKKAKWGNNPPKFRADKLCLRDGDEESWDGYEGCDYISSSNAKQPQIRCMVRGHEPEPGKKYFPYSGCYVNAVIRIWAQDNAAEKGGRRINASLEIVQFLRDGEPFSSYRPADDSQLEYDDEADDLGGEDFPDEDARESAPRKRRRPSRDEEDAEPPRKRRRPSRDEEDAEPPRKRRRPSRDEEDDEPPRKRRRPDPADYDEDF